MDLAAVFNGFGQLLAACFAEFGLIWADLGGCWGGFGQTLGEFGLASCEFGRLWAALEPPRSWVGVGLPLERF